MKNLESTYRSEAFLEYYMNLWGSSVYRLAFAYTRQAADADDVYQEVFIRLLKDTSLFTDIEHVKAWLLRVTINCCHDLARSARKTHAGLTEAPEASLEVSKSLSHDETLDLSSALKKLPEELRAIIHLHYYEGYPLEEIACIAQINPSTLRSRLKKARDLLKEELGGNPYETRELLRNYDGRASASCVS